MLLKHTWLIPDIIRDLLYFKQGQKFKRGGEGRGEERTTINGIKKLNFRKQRLQTLPKRLHKGNILYQITRSSNFSCL